MCHSGDPIQAGADVDRAFRKDNRPVAMLSELVDAVIGADTHLDLSRRTWPASIHRGCSRPPPAR